jgi:hypothetical protein
VICVDGCGACSGFFCGFTMNFFMSFGGFPVGLWS